MGIQVDLSLIGQQLANFWPLLAVIIGLAVGVVVLRFFRRSTRELFTRMRERVERLVS